jgi:tRNA-specific 2-thiouridylase
VSQPANPYAPQDAITRRALPGQGKKVLVALSGGRDSAVAAAILVGQGYEVSGLFLDFFGSASGDRLRPHCRRANRKAAQDIAAKLGIQLYEHSAESAFSTHVLQRAVEDALQGRTSAACTNCQGKLRFESLIQKADELDIGLIATGHFAKLSDEPELGRCLWQAKENELDQSTLLSQLRPSWLKRLLLPIGHLKIEEIRRLATEHGLSPDETHPGAVLSTAGRCFGSGPAVWDLVEKRMGMSGSQKGYFVTRDKQILGEHLGVYGYTVGQRQGLEEPQARAQAAGLNVGTDLCVVEIDPWKHWVVLGPSGDLARGSCLTTSAQWLVPPDFRKTRRMRVQLGHDATRSFDVEARPLIDNQLHLSQPKGQGEFRPKPGESCTFYDGHLCLGGAEILETYFTQAR